MKKMRRQRGGEEERRWRRGQEVGVDRSRGERSGKGEEAERRRRGVERREERRERREERGERREGQSKSRVLSSASFDMRRAFLSWHDIGPSRTPGECVCVCVCV